MNDPNTPPPGQQDKPIAFCQNCGKPLNQVTVRIVGQAIFCEPCLAARLAGVPTSQPYPPTNPGYADPYPPQPPVLSPGPPNPGFAALLGLIPGVGAMYNEQYGKGIVHLMVFAVLISLSNASSLFGLMAFGWVCYMVIEAHHTARARRDGLPLPNPFGLNEVSERLGFQTNWGARTHTPWQPSAPTSEQSQAGPAQPSSPPYVSPVPPWGAPVNVGQESVSTYESTHGYTTFTGRSNGEWNAHASPSSPPPATPPHQGYAAYTQVPTGSPTSAIPDADLAARFAGQRNRFPAGAIWLILLGTLFLLMTTGVFSGFPPPALIGFGLICLAVWLFLRRLTDSGQGFTDTYQIRSLRALRASVWIFLVGLLMILNNFNVIPYHRSWPSFIVLAGIMMLAERMIYSSDPIPQVPPVTQTYTPPSVPEPDPRSPSRDGGF